MIAGVLALICCLISIIGHVSWLAWGAIVFGVGALIEAIPEIKINSDDNEILLVMSIIGLIIGLGSAVAGVIAFFA